VVEKSLKAYLRSRRREIDNRFRTHQLTNLLYECIKFDQQFKNLEKDCRLLNEYYAPTRYPEILGLEFRGYEKDQAEEALKFAKEIYDFVEKRLK
jgi:HEPN domain-containing protein